jgi:hypothetical protein
MGNRMGRIFRVGSLAGVPWPTFSPVILVYFFPGC